MGVKVTKPTEEQARELGHYLRFMQADPRIGESEEFHARLKARIEYAREHFPWAASLFDLTEQVQHADRERGRAAPAPAHCPSKPGRECQGDYGIPMRCEWCDRVMDGSADHHEDETVAD
jgi:hypothetical protein